MAKAASRGSRDRAWLALVCNQSIHSADDTVSLALPNRYLTESRLAQRIAVTPCAKTNRNT